MDASTVAQHSTTDPKNEGSNPPFTQEEKHRKNMF